MRRRTALGALAAALSVTACSAPVPVTVAAGSPSAGGQVVVALGDSVPAGTACGCDPFPDLYARMLSPAASVDNLARAGYTSDDVLGQIGDDGTRATLRAATVVLIMAGANDVAATFDDDGDDAAYQSTAAQVVANLRAAVTGIRQAHGSPVQIVVLGYWNVVKDGAVGLAMYGADGVAAARNATRYCNRALRQAAESAGARYVTTTEAFTGAGRDQDPTGLLAPDGDHPNAQGHQAIADVVYAALPAGG